MSDVTESYGMPPDSIEFFGIYSHSLLPLMSEVLYLQQTFTD